ncbi:unnamed protein product [Adineta steineri]|uniref:Uncharacterized protein n=1 Tax=Adineta steineri TaxID=433720 RepID=A0A820ARL3_9BILA|nr:unnamed protein product [Adineta steineri]
MADSKTSNAGKEWMKKRKLGVMALSNNYSTEVGGTYWMVMLQNIGGRTMDRLRHPNAHFLLTSVRFMALFLELLHYSAPSSFYSSLLSGQAGTNYNERLSSTLNNGVLRIFNMVYLSLTPYLTFI